MKLSSQIRQRRGEQGYIMLTLLLVMALMIIFTAVIVPEITFEIKRDREQEMIHRGVQYSRAIRAYYKKFGRYPAKIEDLENTSQQRFLRKRYKDPLTNKDFRLLHYGEAKLSLNGMGGGMIPGANPIGGAAGLNGPAGFSQPSSFGASNGAFGGSSSAFGASSSSGFGQGSQTMNQTAAGDPSQAAGSDAASAGTSATAGSGTTGATQTGFGNSTSSGDKLSGTMFGGAPIVGVASLSKEPTIRIFDKKKKYSEWQFVYDATLDRPGILITTPYQQQTGFGVTGTPNLNNQINGPNGTSGGFGSSSGMQNTPPPSNNGLGNPNQPTDAPLQQ
jgi:type II secretory pathway pseudopilin PulG